MGYDTERFTNFDQECNHELMCTICAGILKNAKVTKCNHSFCWTCISRWLKQKSTINDEIAIAPCPLCREEICFEHLRAPTEAIRSKLSNLLIKCDFKRHGCDAVVKLKQLKLHVEYCRYRSGLRHDWAHTLIYRRNIIVSSHLQQWNRMRLLTTRKARVKMSRIWVPRDWYWVSHQS